MKLLAFLFIAFIITLAFYLNSKLDKREEKKGKKREKAM